jgi:ribosome maturation factor RimP
LDWVGRHTLIVGTPGVKDVLTTEREFKAFKGFEVHVKVRFG